MKQFRYIARKKDGSLVDGWMNEASEEEARKNLSRRQLNIVLLKQEDRSVTYKISRESLMTTLRELATLRSSGMAIDACLFLLTDTSDDKNVYRVFKRLYDDVSSGMSFSDAVAAQPDAFPFYVSSMLRLGEANGNMSEALLSVAERIEREENLVSEVKSALTYPAFLIFICVAVVFFLFSYVIPNFESMVSDDSQQGALVRLLGWARFFNENATFIYGLLIVAVGVLFHLYRQGVLQSQLMSLMARLPFLKDLVSSWHIVNFSSSMQKLLESKVEITEAVEITLSNVSDSNMSRKLNRVVGMIKEGHTLGGALEQQNIFPPMVIRLVKSGEAGASLPKSFKEINNLYERRLTRGIKRALSILEPAIIMIMGLLVGSIMVVLISGIISVNDIGW
ncbi:type II secretion system F family protein [Oceanimonas baumannii]|uniref:General secretion pathway protein F n=1 Tax=Oceanimonas baumannii TaxID=129578 RepID=A0A235CM49_9GAMM|nr:type II secretion system F family protein [Oceanimonas baumannii]OYD25661.1 type II secretion system protein F [Oceanimonas baumannii]TDW56976.1 general secretion pathway protein F [Oceanimonas baumannii]